MTDEQLKKDCAVKHIRNGALYQVMEECAHAKINGKWEAAVVYRSKSTRAVYVRERDEFLDDFELVSAN